mmetsp:Transcript_22630/g.65817  ORF Transcript_22630/g.65817 Transcript_22630/m.65817 type:complete len:203 (+) Transcript_22630:868-1476(+)
MCLTKARFPAWQLLSGNSSQCASGSSTGSATATSFKAKAPCLVQLHKSLRKKANWSKSLHIATSDSFRAPFLPMRTGAQNANQSWGASVCPLFSSTAWTTRSRCTGISTRCELILKPIQTWPSSSSPVVATAARPGSSDSKTLPHRLSPVSFRQFRRPKRVRARWRVNYRSQPLRTPSRRAGGEDPLLIYLYCKSPPPVNTV